MMIERYRLIEDCQQHEWRLLKRNANYAESIFIDLDDAIRKLPEAIGNVTAIVEVLDSSGAICCQHLIDRDQRLTGKSTINFEQN
jgi:hypothetical protein